MASSKGKLVEGVDVFTDDEPKAKKAPAKRKPTAKSKTRTKSLATKSTGKVSKMTRDIAAEVNARYDAMGEKIEGAVSDAIWIGERLIEQKNKLAHGEWIPWVEENLKFGRREASNYMRAARNGKRVSHLDSLRQLISDGTAGADATDSTEEASDSEKEVDDLGVPRSLHLSERELNLKINEFTKKVKESQEKAIADAKEREKKARA